MPEVGQTWEPPLPAHQISHSLQSLPYPQGYDACAPQIFCRKSYFEPFKSYYVSNHAISSQYVSDFVEDHQLMQLPWLLHLLHVLSPLDYRYEWE